MIINIDNNMNEFNNNIHVVLIIIITVCVINDKTNSSL